MSDQHFNEALKDYFNRYGYVGQEEYYKFSKLEFEKNGIVHIVGEVTDNG